MPVFVYKAIAAGGNEISGELEAVDRVSAVRELGTRGSCVTELRTAESGAPSAATSSSIRVRPRQLAILTRQLAVSLEAGLPLMTALDVMCRELEHAPSRTLLKTLAGRVQQGVSLSDALAEHPRTFSPMYTRLVRVGETGGVLDSILAQLAGMLERQTELKERVKTASIYPALVLLLGIASVAIIVAFIVPRIVESIGADTILLPWPTRVLLAMSDIVRHDWLIILVLVVGITVFWRQVVLRGPLRVNWDGLKLRVPVLGRLVRQLEASRFARSLGILAKGGVSITESLPVVRDTIQNQVMRQAVVELTASIQAGESVARPLQRCGLFPPLLVQMVRVGESTGRLDEMLLRAAEVHESEARVTLDRFVSILPVLMILALACVIGFIVSGLVLAIVEFQAAGGGM